MTDALRILFEENGYRVSVAASVAEAVQVGVHDRPDVALLDFLLDGESGLEVLARWHECGVALPPVVALTGHDDAVVRQRCLDAGCVDVLIKPMATRDLLARTNALANR